MLRFENATGIGHNTKITDAKTGDDITKMLVIERGVTFEINETVTCRARLGFIALDLTPNKTVFETRHPVTGEYLAVAAIEFCDGTRVEIAEDGTPSVIAK
jgi:hypothetical protein